MNKILQIARTFIDQLNQEVPIHADYQYDFDEQGSAFYDCWYFDFLIVPIKPVKETKQFVGAPGFAISKTDFQVAQVGWWFVNEMEKKEKLKNDLDSVLSQTKNQNWDLAALRKLTQIKPSELLRLKKKFQSFDLLQLNNRILVIKTLEKLMEEHRAF